MKSVGMICEYNPFHNGHLYHLKKIKEKFPDYIVVLVLSPTFSQRGEASIINKWDKTKLSLDNGVDLVIELPYPFACQSAYFFVEESIKILNYLKVLKRIAFGFRSFRRFKARIMICKELIKINRKKANAFALASYD